MTKSKAMTINDPMKLLRKRGSNQYKTKRKGNKNNVLKIIGCVAAIAVIIYSYNAYQANPEVYKKVFMGKEVSAEVLKNDPLTVEERAKIKKQTELMEREMILTKEKARVDAEYKAASADLELKLEEVRKEKLSFQ